MKITKTQLKQIIKEELEEVLDETEEALEEGPGQVFHKTREDALDAAYDAIIKRYGRAALMDPMKPMTPAEAEARMNPYVAPPLAPEDKPTETDKRYGRTRRGQKGGSLGS
tara:strand:- start:461 stop:793 length:333 start_codon:yes stop_codon:yes gene_type:complete